MEEEAIKTLQDKYSDIELRKFAVDKSVELQSLPDSSGNYLETAKEIYKFLIDKE